MSALLAPTLPHCVLLTAEEAAGMDDTASFIDADAQRNTLILQAAKAAQRRFTGEPLTGFGEMTT